MYLSYRNKDLLDWIGPRLYSVNCNNNLITAMKNSKGSEESFYRAGVLCYGDKFAMKSDGC